MQLAEFLVEDKNCVYILLKRCCCMLGADGDKSGSSGTAWTHDISLENVTWLCMAHLIPCMVY
jgi:hypothetical protein